METHIELSGEQVEALLGDKAKPLAKKMIALIMKEMARMSNQSSQGTDEWDYDPQVPFKFMDSELFLLKRELRVTGGIPFTHSGHAAIVTAKIHLGFGKTSLDFGIWG